ncbi:hypothetical protein FM107_11455 [Sphingobacterium sp. JB170]|nr:hypothetical protein FM107_11455 [Sphingobacterium sp. JB170]
MSRAPLYVLRVNLAGVNAVFAFRPIGVDLCKVIPISIARCICA